MIILGISAYYHDSAAAIIKNGEILVAAEEERFSRIKHDNSFPFNAINFCLKASGVNLNEVDSIAYYEKPLLKFERVLDNFIQTYPFSLTAFVKGIPEWLSYKIKVEQTIKKKLKFTKAIYYLNHHLSHASSAFYSSQFNQASILTIDGVGEYQTTALWYGNGKKIKLLKSINFPHSLGLLYSTFTAFLGFKVNEDEYKLMGLSAYGKPRYVNQIKKIIDYKDDGSFQLNLHYFSFRENFQMWSSSFEKLFGKPRRSQDRITKRDKDLASSIQLVIEDIYFKMLNHLHQVTKSPNLCLSGGVALNSLANGKIYAHTPFKNIHIFGPAGDSGSAIGAALYIDHCLNSKKTEKSVSTLYLGSSYLASDIEAILKSKRLSFKKFNDEKKLIDQVVKLLKNNKIIGWFQGKMEFGPRALGARSILANPNNRYMKTKVNIIKKREQFRPFAGSILQTEVHNYFKVKNNHYSPTMTFCFEVKKQARNKISAIVHVDNTCRIQTVNQENNKYYRLIKEFYRQTGLACLLNTSFNIKGEPIVEKPEQAINDFIKTKMDYLVIDNYIVTKN